MRKSVIIGIAVGIVIMIIIGIIIIKYVGKECEIADDCLTKDCFTAECKDSKCVYSPIVDCCGNEICEQGETYENCAKDCPNCDDDNECTKDSYDYHEQKCINELIIPCCGNGICDEDAETYSSCSTDCPNCDDNDKFTEDSFNYTTQKCEYIRYSFIDDFEDGDLSGWEVERRTLGSVITENSNKVLRSYGDNDMHSGSEEWTDYAFIGKLKIIKGCAFTVVRESDRFSGRYEFTICPDDNKIEFSIVEYEVGSTVLVAKSRSIPLNEWHNFKIVVKGSNLKFYFNDNLIIAANDENNKMPSGRVGIASAGEDSEVYFDDVKVREF